MTRATEPAQVGERELAAVDPADQHPPRGGVVEARQQVEERRLAGAGGAADRDDLARSDLEIDARQHLAADAVAEVDALHPDRQRPVGEVLGMGGLGQRLDRVEPREGARCGGRCALPEVDDPAERLERPDELQQQRDEERELADRQVALDRVAAAEEEHGRDRERGQEDQARQEPRLDTRLAHGLGADRLGAAREALAHVVLAAEGLHHLDPHDRLVGRLGQVALLRLHDARDREDLVREDVRQDRDRRHREGGEERQPRVDREEDDRGADQHHHALDRLHDAPADEVAHRVDVVRRARDHLARRMPVVEGAREAEVRVVHHPAQPGLDRDADARRGVAAREVDAEAERREHA